MEGGGAAEVGEVVVGQDDVGKIFGLESGGHLAGGFDAGDGGGEAVAAEVALKQERIVGIVFDEENAERLRI